MRIRPLRLGGRLGRRLGLGLGRGRLGLGLGLGCCLGLGLGLGSRLGLGFGLGLRRSLGLGLGLGLRRSLGFRRVDGVGGRDELVGGPDLPCLHVVVHGRDGGLVGHGVRPARGRPSGTGVRVPRARVCVVDFCFRTPFRVFAHSAMIRRLIGLSETEVGEMPKSIGAVIIADPSDSATTNRRRVVAPHPQTRRAPAPRPRWRRTRSPALAALASPAVDPNARREAEAFVTAAGGDPAVVLALLHYLEPASAVAPERHLAACAPLHLRREALARAGRPRPARDASGVLAALAHAEDPRRSERSRTPRTSWRRVPPPPARPGTSCCPR